MVMGLWDWLRGMGAGQSGAVSPALTRAASEHGIVMSPEGLQAIATPIVVLPFAEPPAQLFAARVRRSLEHRQEIDTAFVFTTRVLGSQPHPAVGIAYRKEIDATRAVGALARLAAEQHEMGHTVPVAFVILPAQGTLVDAVRAVANPYMVTVETELDNMGMSQLSMLTMRSIEREESESWRRFTEIHRLPRPGTGAS
jgi:hypothetical protein